MRHITQICPGTKLIHMLCDYYSAPSDSSEREKGDKNTSTHFLLKRSGKTNLGHTRLIVVVYLPVRVSAGLPNTS